MALLATTPAGDDLSGGLERASRELRAAVIAADHTGAELALAHYIETLRQVWEAAPEQERSGSALPVRVRELLAWTREMTIIQRALTADQLRVLQKASYYERPANSHGGLQVRG
jgi:hypothetical protein